MGYASEIFLSPPPDNSNCAICHDVLQDAVSMKECGHTFCDECAIACLETKSCPTCRVAVSGTIPNFYARESIDSMQVRCPEGHDDDRSKRTRGDDGEAIPAETCDWTGRCDDFKKHEDVCSFKVIKCGLEGCTHECKRKDMNNHLSGDGFLLHMNLMKEAYQAKLTEVQDNCNASIRETKRALASTKRGLTYTNQELALIKHDLVWTQKELASTNEQIKRLNTRVTDLESTEFKKGIEVCGAGTSEVNGIYVLSEYVDGAPKFVKKGRWHGQEVTFTLFFTFSCLPGDDYRTGFWAISILEHGEQFYYSNTFRHRNCVVLPNDNEEWYIGTAGNRPLPKLSHVHVWLND